MGSVSSVPDSLSFLTQPGTGLLANLPVQVSATTLQSAPQTDLIALSSAALELQQVNELFGIAPVAEDTAALPVAASTTAPAVNLNLPSGVPAADLTNATPSEKAQIADAATQQQQVQALFSPPAAAAGTINLSA